ncbi:nuclear transport factor 2 family protein [Sphingobium sp. Sx8-8]|uniref:nuclear transport factor 2 family protein n=1 Tax=Sphingobium sp. Sx8-8 TaxID=2933617 RepID=UPI001F592546|nr:nuclear transport factor 2 family protein [Sphingobium sp. Sx8-8]
MTITADDRDMVRDLIARQKFRTDDRDLDGVAQCWASDGRLELHVPGNPAILREGRDAILAFVKDGWARSSHRHVHLVTTLQLTTRDDGRIGVESYCLYLSADDLRTQGYGRYSDICVREEGQWRIHARTVRTQWAS